MPFSVNVSRGRERSVTAAATPDVKQQIRDVAAKHQEEAVGYGETAWNPDTKTVLYVAGDWTDPDPVQADMLAIDGVENFDSEAEGLPDGWWDSEVVYPENPPKWVTDPNLAVISELVCEAATPLDVEAFTVEPNVPDEAMTAILNTLATRPSETVMEDPAFVRALETLAAAHQSTVEGVAALVAGAATQRGTSRDDTLTLAALELVKAVATKPAPLPQPITVNVPDTHVNVEAPIVNVPEQSPLPAPVVHVAAAEAPVVNVTVPEQKPQEAPVVTVNVPETHVDVHVPAAQVDVHVPAQPHRAVRVEYDDAGQKRYVTEDA